MNVDNELADFDAAGSLAEELPYWGWLDDERTCLTRAGELMSLARVSPSVLDGQTPEQRDRVIDRWQRMLSEPGRPDPVLLLSLEASHPLPGSVTYRCFQGGDTRPAKAPGISRKAGAGRVGLRCMGLRSGAIHRGIREGRRAVVDDLREELDGASAERAEVRLPPFLD